MKKLLLLLVSFPLLTCYAQNARVVTITPSMFDTVRDQQFLSTTDGWLFRLGNDTAWAKKTLDVNGWQKLSPAALTAKYADKTGRLECWFRIKIKLDKAFGNKVFGIAGDLWGAADYYIDGKLVSSLGNTGQNGKPFREFTPYNRTAVPVDLNPGVEYTLAIHFVDRLTPLPPAALRSERWGMEDMIRLTGPDYNSRLFTAIKQNGYWVAMWVSVCVVLSALFWFLYIQNRFEKNLRLIAFNSTFVTLAMYFIGAHSNPSDISYLHDAFNIQGSNFFGATTMAFTPLIIAGIFKKSVSVVVKSLLAICALNSVPIDLLPPAVGHPLVICIVSIMYFICLYYIIPSRKTLRGAQWSIVVGLVFSMTGGLAALISRYTSDVSVFYVNLLLSLYCLSFPISLLVYVAMRFKEILKEVQFNANQVVQLSEEKKQEALNRQKLLEEEVARQTAEIRANQAKLIQSEKMASLGELTAGIAHEIQNPLNFVNNFSEVSVELLGELKEEAVAGNTEDVIAITDDLTQNLEKIRHHGKRADSIVKGMLEHSRASAGQKEPTDLNALADEYLRLAYHGLRAKDKSFNAELITDFDKNLPKAKVVTQDMGRVLLNLFNNAFYAVKEKAKTAAPNYKPTVEVTTFTPPEGGWGVLVKDNGNGIPNEIKEKIMQPFFTTKPTGEGTGLGLSLSYDIVVKGHGGTIEVQSAEGKGSEFIIKLPLG